MKNLLYLIFIFALWSCDEIFDLDNEHPTKGELDGVYLSKWSIEERNRAATAADAAYLTPEEKEIYFYLNLARINPPLFADTYASGYTGENGWGKGYAFDERRQSLIEELTAMQPLKLLYPDEALYEFARCYAIEGGEKGYLGHYREHTDCENLSSNGYAAECIQYGGGKNGLSIVMALLIDAGENNANLGHRKVCLKEYPLILGASIKPHISSQFNAVLNFAFDFEHIPDYSESEEWMDFDGIRLKNRILFSDGIEGYIYKKIDSQDYYIQKSPHSGFWMYLSKTEAIQALYAYLKYGKTLRID